MMLIQVRAVALSRECRFLDELRYHLSARWHGAEQEFGFNRRMQVNSLLEIVDERNV